MPFPDPKPVVLPRAAVDPDRRTFVIENQIDASRADVAKAREALAALERESKDSEKLESARNELACADAQLAERLAVERAEALKARGLKDSAEWKAAAELATKVQRAAAVESARRAEAVARVARRKVTSPGRAEADKTHAQAQKALA